MADNERKSGLWKVTVSSLFPNGHEVQETFEGYHDNEETACDATLTQVAINHGGSTLPTIVKVEEV